MLRLLPLLLAACAGGGSSKVKVDLTDDTPTTGVPTTGTSGPAVTWYGDVGPVLLPKCGACHQAGGIGPFSMASYEEVQPWDTAIQQAIDAGTMPPWAATEHENCTPNLPFKDDPRLTEDEKQLVRDWVAAGSPAGTPRDLTVPEPPDLVDPDLVVSLQQPFSVSGTSDIYQCFRIPVPDQGGDRWITDLQVLPDNLAVVHHVLVWVDRNDQSAGMQGPDGSYPCSGTPDIWPAELVGTWAPGQPPVHNPPTTGAILKQGASIVVNVHYHPLATSTELDSTQIALKLTDVKPDFFATYYLIDQPFGATVQDGSFFIPAGEAQHEEILSFDILSWIPLPGLELPIFSIMPHMHYRGTEMRVQIVDNAGNQECLIEANPFRFDFQTAYSYDATAIDQLPTLGGGESLQVRCRYDNSWQNPYMEQALDAAGQTDLVDVGWGEATGDEMCMAVVGFLTPFDLWQWF